MTQYPVQEVDSWLVSAPLLVALAVIAIVAYWRRGR